MFPWFSHGFPMLQVLLARSRVTVIHRDESSNSAGTTVHPAAILQGHIRRALDFPCHFSCPGVVGGMFKQLQLTLVDNKVIFRTGAVWKNEMGKP